jgi:hypothetical protein
MRKPFGSLNLFVCGEAWSDDQGWINGALQTSEKMLQAHFALAWPDNWLDRNVSLGPPYT